MSAPRDGGRALRRTIAAAPLVLALLFVGGRLAEAPAPARASAHLRPALAAVLESASPAPALHGSLDRADVEAARAALTQSPRVSGAAHGRRDREPHERRGPVERVGAMRLALLEASGLLRRGTKPFTIAGVTHTRFEVTKHGLPFLDRGGRIHERNGAPLGVTGRTTFPPLARGGARIGRTDAIALARAATGTELLMAPPRARLGWLAHAGASRLAFEVTLAARAPLADWRVFIDATSGEVLGRVDRLARFDGVGVVYDKNPKDSKTPSEQTLRELDGSGRLTGRITAVFDDFFPEAFAPDLRFEFPTADPRFVQTSVYRGLTETGLLAERFGVAAVEPDYPSTLPVPAFTGLLDVFTGGPLNNAFYAPSIPAFGFGDGDGEVLRNVGTDIDVPAHEFGHHVFEVLVQPEVFSFDDPVLAMSEGVADTFSLLIGGDERIGNSVVPGAGALRSLGSGATFPDALDADPHQTGLVYGGANRDIARKLGNDAFGELLIAALPNIPPDAMETDYRDAFLDADATLNLGANEKLLQQVFRARGFDELALPEQFQGDLIEGMPETGTLADGEFHFYLFSELPPSQTLLFQTTGTGDADLVVLPLNFEDAALQGLFSGSVTSDESVQVTPFSLPTSIDADDFWLVIVQDFPDNQGSTYTLTGTATPGADQISIGGPIKTGSIVDPANEIDFFQFSGSAGQRVRVEVEHTSGTIDPLVAVVTREPFEVLDADDDSGEADVDLNVDALLQGVELPATGTYAIAVLSAVADFDPSVGAGDYQLKLSLCNNVGPDFDGDGTVDACDQDDDDDTFVDDEDLDPLDPAICIDVDADECNDCANGAYDPFDDGTDTDGDATCDVGDDDDDNDGCSDADDPAPLAASVDADFDFLGLDCDNCAEVPNPQQEDADDDGAGDACSACSRIDWQAPPSTPPDQNPAAARIQISSADRPGRAKLRASGEFTPAGAPELHPDVTGVQLRLADGNGVVTEVAVPGGLAPCDPADVWKVKDLAFSYTNKSGALPPGCAPGSAQGLSQLRLTDERGVGGAIVFDARWKNATLAGPLARPVRFLQLDLVLGTPPDPGIPSAEGLAGECAESVLRVGTPVTDCRISEKDGVVRGVRCQPR